MLGKVAKALNFCNPQATSSGLTGSHCVPPWRCSRWGLHSWQVAMPMVNSYLTFPPLPEEKILQLQDKKRELIESVIEPGTTFLDKLSGDEIRELFNLQAV